MKCAVLVASLLLVVQANPKATDGSCKGKMVNVFLDSSFLSSGDFWSYPDTYIKVGCLCLLK